MRLLDVPDIVPAVGGYSHGVRVDGALVFVSGQTPEDASGRVSDDPERQLRQIWDNLRAVLAAAGARVEDVVHVRTYLSERSYRELNTRIRTEVLGTHAPALTVVICDLYEPGWVAEIELVAAVAHR